MLAMGVIGMVMTGNIIGAAILLPIAVYFIVQSFELFYISTELYYMALFEGNEDASDALAFQAQLYATFHMVGYALRPVFNAIGNKFAQTTFAKKVSDLIWKENNRFIAANDWYQKWIMKGYSSHMV